MIERNGRMFEFDEGGEKHYAIADDADEALDFVRECFEGPLDDDIVVREVPTTETLTRQSDDEPAESETNTVGAWTQIEPKGFFMSTVFAC